MTRAKNPRRVAHAVLKAMKSNIQAMCSTWSFVPDLRYWDNGDGRGRAWRSERRKRADVPAFEYRENSPTEWLRLVDFMETVERQARSVAQYARERAAETAAGTVYAGKVDSE